MQKRHGLSGAGDSTLGGEDILSKFLKDKAHPLFSPVVRYFPLLPCTQVYSNSFPCTRVYSHFSPLYSIIFFLFHCTRVYFLFSPVLRYILLSPLHSGVFPHSGVIPSSPLYSGISFFSPELYSLSSPVLMYIPSSPLY